VDVVESGRDAEGGGPAAHVPDAGRHGPEERVVGLREAREVLGDLRDADPAAGYPPGCGVQESAQVALRGGVVLDREDAPVYREGRGRGDRVYLRAGPAREDAPDVDRGAHRLSLGGDEGAPGDPFLLGLKL